MVPAAALAQTDPESLAAGCVGELTNVQTALDDEDEGRALVLLDLAGEACSAARRALVDAVSSADAGDTTALDVLWRMELRRVALFDRVASCDDARDVLRSISGEADLPESLRTDFATTAYSALRCGPRIGGSGGTIAASPGMYDVMLAGRTIGEQSASDITLDSYCSGWIPYSPSYTLEVTSDMTVSLSAYSASDLVLVVIGPSGQIYCNDDYDGLNPGLSEWMSAGSYSVYVGEYSASGFGAEYSLTVSGTSLTVSPSYVYPTYGTAYLGPSYGRTTLSGTVWGANDASTSFDATCAGWVAENPDFQLYTDYDTDAWINVTGAAGTDLTLIVDGPDGRHCVDDSSGLNPNLNTRLSAGTYNVWVGDNAGAGTGASYGIQFSSYDPMLTLASDPTFGSATMGPGSTAETFSGTTSAVVPASDFFGSTCYGSIGTAPSHTLTVTEAGMFEIVARSDPSSYGDMVIAVSGPSGTWCNDDYDGLNPGVRRFLDPGEYTIYVGDLSGGYPGSTGTPFTTTITASVGTPPPSIGTSGTYGDVTIGPGYGTTTLGGAAGGPVAANTFDSTCRGYVTLEPSFIMEVTASTFVTVQILAEGDTTLVISGPDGVFCNDDFNGLNPGLAQTFSAGRFGIWVGSYGAGTTNPFMASFQESSSY
jgi:hypothetical protein